jgi:DNA-binding CsgD family transcriptional regulator
MVGQSETDRAKVTRLTAKQRECMRLVVLRKSSKEIARELGIAKPTVDQRITNARQILGARNRDEAAIIFARGTTEYDRVIYDSARVCGEASLADMPTLETRQELGLRLDEPAMAYGDITEQQSKFRPGFQWSHPSEFDTTKRLAIIVGMTFSILAMILIGLSVAQSLTGLLAAP